MLVRQACRNAIESLERWLRQTVREAFTRRYGTDFMQSVDERGQYVIQKRIRDDVAKRAAKDPNRYPHPLDALHLDDIIDIICHENHFNRDFKPALANAFPQGREVARTFLRRLILPRNSLSHDNPISVRQAEQVICYCNDVIDSLKEHARVTGNERLYNVPVFTRFEDSRGNRPVLPEITGESRPLNFMADERSHLRPGDRIRLCVEVDASFSEDQYKIRWASNKRGDLQCNEKCIVLNLTEQDVGQHFTMFCYVTSNKAWHRCNGHDDLLLIYYTVLFPLE